MTKRSTWIGGGNDLQDEIDHRGYQERQLKEIYADADARTKAGEDAIKQLELAREQMLALSSMVYAAAELAEREGHWDSSTMLCLVGRFIRDIRANQVVPELTRTETETETGAEHANERIHEKQRPIY